MANTDNNKNDTNESQSYESPWESASNDQAFREQATGELSNEQQQQQGGGGGEEEKH
eukprot:CAMPEP_0170779228 /NCGR_PEP_ID=MMETSP0733-20121128/12858_1 /TAXON_ID=186038 /ORGANISM="Fragilariopsis kerguelensis, Strain L26-C5" /LENGTH=56 /DNA_ID=CAMNT_0011122795 /DNA_START=240 /DNA_END=410 /DNA_ORIENTATION=-